MTRGIEVPDSVGAVKFHFNERQIIDLVATVAAWQWCRFFLGGAASSH
jgi:alkylhydroperoxidase family enzyme